MPDLLFWVGVFFVSLVVLIKAADFFTHAAEKLGLYLGMPAFIVGVTIVAVGTSLPEIVSSVFAVLAGSSEIVVGNVVGSNIANIFLILGIAAIFAKKLNTRFEILHVDLPVLVAASFLFAFTIIDGTFTLGEAVLLLVGMVIYFIYAAQSEGRVLKLNQKKEAKKLGAKTVAILLISTAFIYLGAKYTIDSVIVISDILGIGKEILAASAVALGTSLPELVVSVNAARKGKSEIAIGNVLGSNIFNSFAVMGIPALIGTLVIPQSIIYLGLPMMLVASVLFFFMMQEKEITTWEGLLLVLFYVFFIGKLFSIF